MYWEQQSERLWQLMDPGTEFLPTRVFGSWLAYVHSVDPAGYRPPDGYADTHELWFGLWEEREGLLTLLVFYPKSPVEGELIDVVVRCPHCGVSVTRWTHGEPGLAQWIDDDAHCEGWCSPDPRFHQAPHGTDAEMVQWYDGLIGKMVEYGTAANDIAYATEIRNYYATRVDAAEACKKRIQGKTVASMA